MLTRQHEEALDRWWAGLRQTTARLVLRRIPRLAVAALEIEAARLDCPQIPRLFSRDLHQIDPSLNHDLLELFARSDFVLSNKFAFLRRPQQFGAEINWECPESPGWRSELHAFDYALDLALTYRISGEARYAQHLRYLIAHWIATNLPVEGTGWSISPLARRLRNWILAADLARTDWEDDQDFFRIAKDSLALQSTYLLYHLNLSQPDFFATDSIRALFLAGKFFSGTAGAELCNAALTRLREKLEPRTPPNCFFMEDRPRAQLCLAAALLERLILEPNASEASFLKEKLRETLSSLDGILLPNAVLPLFGSQPRENFADLAALAAVLLRDPKWKILAGKFGIFPYMWLGEKGKKGFESLPEETWRPGHRLLPQCGFYRLSGGDSSALVVNARGCRSPNHHWEYLSFELSVQNQRVIVDSGAYAPEAEPENKYFASAVAHNLLFVDRQSPSAEFLTASVTLPEKWESGNGFAGVRLPDPGFAILGVQHQRAWFLLEDRFWLIVDRLEGTGSHSTISLLHFFPTFEIQVFPERAIARTLAQAVTIIPVGQADAELFVSRGDHGDFPGWYAPQLGIKYPASVLAIRWARIDLPWVGGVVIIPAAETVVRPNVFEFKDGSIDLELFGKRYALAI